MQRSNRQGRHPIQPRCILHRQNRQIAPLAVQERQLWGLLAQGVIMATHDSSIVDQMRRRVLELRKGELVRDQAKGVYGVN